MKIKLSVAAALGLLMAGVPAWGHHSFAAEYDSQQLITLKGVITQVDWTNPHIYIHLDVKDASGHVTNWAVEGYPPNTLKRTGFAKSLLNAGTEVTITAYKAKDATNTGAAREIIFADGSKKFAGPAGQ
jgi:uncharacterized protein DUF6152